MQDVRLPGFEGHRIQVNSGALSGHQLFVDGRPAPTGPKRGQFLLRRNDGREVIGQFKDTFPDPIPFLIVDGTKYLLAKPLSTAEWIWVALPMIYLLLLPPVYAPIGAALGVVATTLNAQVFRSLPNPARWILTGLLTVGAFLALMFIAALVLVFIFGPDFSKYPKYITHPS